MLARQGDRMAKLNWLMVGAFALISPTLAAFGHDQGTWIGTWGTSPVGLPTVTKIGAYTMPPPITIKGTIRYRLRVSSGGSARMVTGKSVSQSICDCSTDSRPGSRVPM